MTLLTPFIRSNPTIPRRVCAAAGFVLAVFMAIAPAAATTQLYAAVLPLSRSVQVGATATAFATIINAYPAAASGCSITPSSAVPAKFLYQTTDPRTNALTGTANTPAVTAAGGAQSFVIAFTPTAPFAPIDVTLTFNCAATEPAAIITGLDTLLLSASTVPVPDIVVEAETFSHDGILKIFGVSPGPPGCPGCGLNAFVIATFNLGSGTTITAAPIASPANLPISLAICQTNAFGVCVGGPSGQTPSVTLMINGNATPTFGVFATATGAIPFAPAMNRVFVGFSDSDGALRGLTSVAVQVTVP